MAAMRALWTQERATLRGLDGVLHATSYLRPQPPAGSIPIHIGGHSEVAARRAGRIGDGFFPFGVGRDELPGTWTRCDGRRRGAGRDPTSVEVTVSSYHLDPVEAAAEIDALGAMGVDARRGAGRPVPGRPRGRAPALRRRRDRSQTVGCTVRVPPPRHRDHLFAREELPMSLTSTAEARLRHPDRFFVGGEWVEPTSTATIDVLDSGTEELFFTVAEAREGDMDRAIAAARQAFDSGPWPRMSHAERAEYLRRLAAGIAARADDDRRRSGHVSPASSSRWPDTRLRPPRRRSSTTPSWPTPSSGSGRPSPPARVRHPLAGAGRGRGRHHPVERADGTAQLQGRPRPDRRLHRRPEVVPGGPRRGLRGGRGRRRHRPSSRACSTW